MDDFKEINDVQGVFMRGNEIVITGCPKEDDENHNCDEMGCGSLEHMTCEECTKGKIERVVGNGITEPPYVRLVRCPYDSEYYMHPDNECCHADKSEMGGGGDGL